MAAITIEKKKTLTIEELKSVGDETPKFYEALDKEDPSLIE